MNELSPISPFFPVKTVNTTMAETLEFILIIYSVGFLFLLLYCVFSEPHSFQILTPSRSHFHLLSSLSLSSELRTQIQVNLLNPKRQCLSSFASHNLWILVMGFGHFHGFVLGTNRLGFTGFVAIFWNLSAFGFLMWFSVYPFVLGGKGNEWMLQDPIFLILGWIFEAPTSLKLPFFFGFMWKVKTLQCGFCFLLW